MVRYIVMIDIHSVMFTMTTFVLGWSRARTTFRMTGQAAEVSPWIKIMVTGTSRDTFLVLLVMTAPWTVIRCIFACYAFSVTLPTRVLHKQFMHSYIKGREQ